MKSLLAKLVAISTLFFLVACNFVLPPVSSAVVEQHFSGNQPSTVELSQAQISTLSAWFTQHSSGWSSSAASYAPALIVRAKHSNGEISVVNILGSSVIVYNSSGQFTQQFTGLDLAALKNILGAK